MDGGAIYFPCACIWLAVYNGIEVNAANYILLVILATFGSMGKSLLLYIANEGTNEPSSTKYCEINQQQQQHNNQHSNFYFQHVCHYISSVLGTCLFPQKQNETNYQELHRYQVHHWHLLLLPIIQYLIQQVHQTDLVIYSQLTG